MEIKFHGHACFELSDGETTLLVDPFLKPHNPVAVTTAEDVSPTHVIVSHDHADHIADAIAIANANRAEMLAIVETANRLREEASETVHDPNLGGTVRFDWGWVKLVPAWHTTTTGTPAGLVISIGGVTVYHCGDTCLFGDMKLIAERTPVDVALLPIGGHYTMDRHDGVAAAELIGAGTVIPMHYNTFPPIQTDAAAFKSEVEAQTSSQVVLLDPGETHTV